jgi:excisionase family DNA binding protein
MEPEEKTDESGPQLMTLAEAAQFLRLNPRTLENWSRGSRPRVPVIRLGDMGRKILFNRSDLERWLREHTIRPRREKV